MSVLRILRISSCSTPHIVRATAPRRIGAAQSVLTALALGQPRGFCVLLRVIRLCIGRLAQTRTRRGSFAMPARPARRPIIIAAASRSRQRARAAAAVAPAMYVYVCMYSVHTVPAFAVARLWCTRRWCPPCMLVVCRRSGSTPPMRTEPRAYALPGPGGRDWAGQQRKRGGRGLILPRSTYVLRPVRQVKAARRGCRCRPVHASSGCGGAAALLYQCLYICLLGDYAPYTP